ncbi:MAG: hypothetical protein RSA51_07255 [Niameybacter sp.]
MLTDQEKEKIETIKPLIPWEIVDECALLEAYEEMEKRMGEKGRSAM